MRLEPGLLAFLETRIEGSETSIGAGYQAAFNIPFGIAATAAYALLAPAQPEGVSWSGFDVEIEWSAGADSGDTLLADAAVEACDSGLAVFAIAARSESGRELLTGRLRLRAVRNGKTLHTSLLMRPVRPADVPHRLDGYAVLANVDAPARMELAQLAPVLVSIANDSDAVIRVSVSFRLPFGGGICIHEGSDTAEIEVPPHSFRTVRWKLRADRPDAVNLREPWPVEVIARCGEITESYTFRIGVRDNRPGRVFYVLTEDCETFDGGPRTGDYGALAALGNRNNFMDPEDYRVQMIEKPDRMNQIAERHGARWTHFWCVPQRFAVDWAAAQSKTGQWPLVGAALDESIRRGSVVHEYAPHIHFDYEPDSRHPPQPRLIYDAATDGILPNEYYDPVVNPRHHFHDWDGSGRGISYVKRLGEPGDADSKTGSLRKCMVYLARMQANRRCPIIARTGGLDFGVDAEDQVTSTSAYEANGLLASSDARVDNPPGGAYFCDPRDRTLEVQRSNEIRLAQLAVTHETNFLDSEAVNAWFSGAMKSCGGPGVHLISVMTHAMFMRGEPDSFRSLEGGSFSGLDRHLAWVRAEYPCVRFATASEALEEYIDYYSPRLVASAAPVLCGGDPEKGTFEYPVRLLGTGIRVDAEHPAELTIRAPALFEERDIERLRILVDREPVAEEASFDGVHHPAITVTLSQRPRDLRLQVVIRASSISVMAALLPRRAELRFQDVREPDRPMLFRLRPASACFAPADLLRLLMNPIGGNTEPLGRRVHPLGVFVMGAALTAALEQAGEEQPSRPVLWRPWKLRLRWRKAVAMDSDPGVDCRATGDNLFAVRVRDSAGDPIADSEIELAPIPGPA